MALSILSLAIYNARLERRACVPGTAAFAAANERVAAAFDAWNRARSAL